MKRKALIQVFISIFLAVFAGWMSGPALTVFNVPIVRIYHLLGQLFINALTFVMIPLVMTSVIGSVAQMGAEGSLGSLGKKTFYYFLLTGFIAVVVGFIFVTVLQPGSSQELANVVTWEVSGDPFSQVEELILKVVPSNLFKAAVNGEIFGLLFFSFLFGYFIAKIDAECTITLLQLVKGVYHIMIRIIRFMMYALPIGVFGLVAEVVATTGFEGIRSALWFMLTVIAALCFYMFVVMPIVLNIVGRVNPFAHMRTLAPALLTAFTTSSSTAAVGVAIECMEKKGRNARKISHLTLPLGSSLNLPGTALFLCVTVFFLAQLYGIHMTLSMQVTVIIMSLLCSFGIAGVPSASLVSLFLVLHLMEIPTQGVGLILAVERVVDMFRSTVNLFGNSCSTAFVAGTKGEWADAAEPST